MISCLYPDCEYNPEHSGGMSPELLKRQTIDHINHDHDDAHVIIACHHELREVERYMATTISGQTGKQVDVGEQVKSECVRCGQFVVEDAPDA